MANLETLELTIRANAESASQGVNNLIGSLTRLSKVVGKSVGGLRLLVSELKKLEEYSGVKLPDFAKAMSTSKAVSGIKARAKAVKELTDAEKESLGNRNAINKASPDAKSYEEWKREYDERMRELHEKHLGTEARNQQRKEWQERVAEEQRQKSIAQETAEAAENTGVMSKILGYARGVVQHIAGQFSKINRILSTMLIRTAIRSLLKGFTNAWNSMYEFSKSVNGDFAKSIDTIKGLTMGAAQNIISAFAPALTALVPIVNTVAAAINYLANAIKWLLSLLGTGSELFGATTEEINKFSGAASGGSSAAKEMLASFDELNVISSKGGGGGGGGGGTTALMPSNLIESEMAEIGIIASKATLALGLILACTGHIGLGAALIAVGAAGIAKAAVENWDKLPSEIQNRIVTISAVSEALMLATGLILALTGANIPLGIGLIAAGAVGLATTASLSWTLDNTIKEKIGNIMEAVGAGLLAIGAILTFTGASLPLGIGLMIAGATAFAGAVALKWGIEKKIENVVKSIEAIVGGALLGLGAVITFTGANIPLGIGMMIAGATAIAASVGVSWSMVPGLIKIVLYSLTSAVGGAMLAIGALIAFTGANVPLGIGLIVAGAASLVAAASLSWSLDSEIKNKIGIVQSAVGGAMLAIGAVLAFTGAKVALGVAMMAVGAASIVSAAILTWGLDNSIKQIIGTLTAVIGGSLLALGAVIAFTGAGLGLGIGLMIAGAVSLAASASLTWSLEGDIKRIITGLETVVGGAMLALGAILTFTGANVPLGLGLMAAGGISLVAAIAPNWNTVVQNITGVFTTVRDFLVRKWEDIKKAVSNAWNAVAQWWDENIASKVSAAWESFTSTVAAIFQPVLDLLNGAWELIQLIFGYGEKQPIDINAIVNYRTVTGTSSSGSSGTKLSNVRMTKASGAFGIDRGDVFIANEAGAELVGSINGKTSVANQEQIIEGIARGVESANQDQNTLLREQNTLLRQILQKDNSVRLSASAQLGRVTRQSLDMYGSMVGG